MADRNEGYSYNYIPTAATTQVKVGPGLLKALIINTPINADTIKIIDNTAGSTTNLALITVSGTVPQVIEYNVKFSTGLRIITSGNDNVTVVYA